MMTINEIYKQYRTMPNLCEHMLRVAAVAYEIVHHMHDEVIAQQDRTRIINATLLHDMGNIIKFNLPYAQERFPEFLEPEGLDHWLSVQQSFFDTYGMDEHAAHLAIAREIGVDERTIELMNAVGLSGAGEQAAHADLAKKICIYADMRVGPHGVMSIAERVGDLRERKQQQGGSREVLHSYDVSLGHMQTIEEQIFEHVDCEPRDINDDSVQKTIEQLVDWKIGKT